MQPLNVTVCALALGYCAPALASAVTQDKPVSQKEISRELERLFTEHFQDQNGITDEAELARRQKPRVARVHAIIAAGQLATLDDWDHAAVILQYSSEIEDVLLAHALVIPPGIKDISASRNLVAGTLDRYVAGLGKPEIFGTQSTPPESASLMRIGADGKAIPDSIRKLFQLDPLRDKEKKSSRAPSVKELAKLLASDLAQDSAARLARVRDIVAGGSIESARDFEMAAQILLSSSDADDLLLAHVLALAASFRGVENGLAVSATTLDRYLLATGRGQLLGTVKQDDGKLREPSKPAPEVVVRGFASAKAMEK